MVDKALTQFGVKVGLELKLGEKEIIKGELGSTKNPNASEGEQKVVDKLFSKGATLVSKGVVKVEGSAGVNPAIALPAVATAVHTAVVENMSVVKIISTEGARARRDQQEREASGETPN